MPIFDELKTKTEDPIEKLESKTKELEIAKQNFIIKSETDYRVALTRLKELSDLDKEIHELTDPVCNAANKAHKEATGMRSKLLAPVTTLKSYFQRLIGDYDYEQEKIRKAEAAKIEAERQKKIDDDKLAKAAKFEEAGLFDEAEAIMDEEVEVVSIVVEKPKEKGLQFRDNWQIEITDVNLIPRKYLIPDLSALGAIAKARGAEAKATNTEPVSDIPGVKFVNERKAITR